MKSLLTSALILLCTFYSHAQTKVPYTVAENYFLRNDAQQLADANGAPMDYVFIESAADLERTFGYATSMGPKGKPTAIDYQKQFAIGLFVTAETSIKNLVIGSVTQKGKALTIAYQVVTDNKVKESSRAFKILIFDKKYGGPVNTVKTVVDAAAKPQIGFLEKSGDQGQVTFSQQGKTIFYYSMKDKKGAISVDGKIFDLTQYRFVNNQGKSKADGYSLSGKGVSVSAPNLKPTKDNSGGDCLYGTIPVVTVRINGKMLTVKNVSVQDCPDY